LTPIGLALLNSALIAFSFSNTFLSLGSFDPPFSLLIWTLPSLPALLWPLSWLLAQLVPQKIVLKSALVAAGHAINSGVVLHILMTHLWPLIQPSSLHDAVIVVPTIISSTFVSIVLNF